MTADRRHETLSQIEFRDGGLLNRRHETSPNLKKYLKLGEAGFLQRGLYGLL